MARLLFFGRLTDQSGGRERALTLPEGGCSVSAVVETLAGSDAALGDALRDPSIRAALNGAFVDADAIVTENDELAFLPPASGG
ncbi:MAG: MoaD/ThiS family protein [Pseudomonadota bacterium]